MSDFKQYPHLPDEPEQSTPYPTPRHFDEPDWDDTFDDFFGKHRRKPAAARRRF